MYEQYDGKERVCGACECKKKKLFDWVCNNKESENYSLEVEYNDGCQDWQEKNK